MSVKNDDQMIKLLILAIIAQIAKDLESNNELIKAKALADMNTDDILLMCEVCRIYIKLDKTKGSEK